MRQWNAIKTLVDATKTFPIRWLTLEIRRLPRARSEIAANFNLLHFLRNLLNVGRALAKTLWCDEWRHKPFHLSFVLLVLLLYQSWSFCGS